MTDTPAWCKPREFLKSIPRNSCPGHHHVFETDELTFFGFPEQPDWAHITVDMMPNKNMVELKSFKVYLLHFRDVHMSYERALDTIFNDLLGIYEPFYLKVSLTMHPRGGVTSTVYKEGSAYHQPKS
jgi:7-cyano-7-deazaguanine reductase